MALYMGFGDDVVDGGAGAGSAPAPTPSSSVWTPGLVIAALALGAAWLMHSSAESARRQARTGKRWPPYEHVVKRARR